MKHPSENELPRWSAYLAKLGGGAERVLASHPEIGNVETPAAAVAPSVLPRTEPAPAKMALGMWGFYFVAKLMLFALGAIAFHTWENLAFAGLIVLSSAMSSWRRTRNAVVTVLAISLLYHDSWLPPLSRVFSQASLLSSFSPAYFAELIFRFVSLPVLGLLILAWGIYRLASRRVHMGVLAIAGMVVAGMVQFLPASHSVADAAMPDMDKAVQDFFTQEGPRSVLFTAPPASAMPFDVIFIHVCSLAWDDVVAAGLEHHALWQDFDILLTKFNSATAYSGPAAIHLLRATCGQQEHGRMYSPVPEKCYLMNSLLRAGFEPNLALNHDGKFDDFLGQVQMHGRLTASPLPLEGVEIAQRAFDGAPIYNDLSVLNRWLDARSKSSAGRVALYYNTISLHDGNQSAGQPGKSSLETYRPRLATLLDNMEQFMKRIEQSGRRAVVVMVPEHGAAVLGDKKQIAGLREIPTPAITIVPVGIKVVGGNVQRGGATLAIDKPTSYLAISHIVERMLQRPPFASGNYAPADYVVDLPLTQYVAQNENATVAEANGRYYVKHDSSGWEAQ